MRIWIYIIGFALLMSGIAPAYARKAVSINERHVLELKEKSGKIEIKLKRPAKFSPRSLPAVLLFGGFETGARAIDLFEDGLPFLLATFEYPFSAPRKIPFPEGLKYLPTAKSAVHNTLAGMHQLIEWTRLRPEVDPDRIILVGASFGAPFVSIVAGDNPNVKALILAHGFGDVPGTIAYRLADKWRPKWGIVGKWFASIFAQLIWWYANVPSPEEKLSLLRQHQEALLLTARDDDLIPQKSVDVLRIALDKSNGRWEERAMPGTHLRPGETQMIQQLLKESMHWMEQRGIARSSN